MFSIKIGGNLFYILSDPRHVATFYRETESLPFDPFLEKTIVGFGISPEGIRKIFDKPLSGDRKSIVWRAHDMQAEQCRGPALLSLASHISKFLQESVVLNPTQVQKEGAGNWSLKGWTTETIIHSIQDVYFGEKLANIDPELPHILGEFDELSYMAWYRYPWIFKSKLNRHGDRIRQSLKEFFEIPKEERKSAAWFTQGLEDECRASNFKEADLISLMLFMYWG